MTINLGESGKYNIEKYIIKHLLCGDITIKDLYTSDNNCFYEYDTPYNPISEFVELFHKLGIANWNLFNGILYYCSQEYTIYNESACNNVWDEISDCEFENFIKQLNENNCNVCPKDLIDIYNSIKKEFLIKTGYLLKLYFYKKDNLKSCRKIISCYDGFENGLVIGVRQHLDDSNVINMSIDEFAALNLIKSVIKKNKKYSVNNAPFQTTESLLTFIWKNKNITLDKKEFEEYLDNLATEEKITEKKIQEKIQRMFGGKREVHTPVGYIDLLNDEMIIEAKRAKDWKGALGQIISYAKFYPEHQKALYLFGECPGNISECYKLCRENKIKLYGEFW